ncbi:MAG: hypothetical protein IT557_15080 [Alphaproteobacteria bacterium]|nr:hypothetical protein [Alphaproteobacteria bacterium]
MTPDQFRRSLARDAPPAGLSAPLAALWWEARGHWDKAHALAQSCEALPARSAGYRDGAWVHAYLHRREGDPANAAYWYRRAGRAPATEPMEAEWAAIAAALLGAEPAA